MKTTIVLNQDEWDRILEIIDFSGHSDKQHLLTRLNTQLHYSPADEPTTIIYKDEEYKFEMKKDSVNEWEKYIKS